MTRVLIVLVVLIIMSFGATGIGNDINTNQYTIQQRIKLKLYDTCDVQINYYALRVQRDEYKQDERSRYLLKVWKKRCNITE